MTQASDNPLNDVLALAQERERYESWLATLNARKGAVAPGVYDRVRADYETRLNAVVERLSGHTAAIEQRRTEITGDLGKVDAEERSAREAREEAELRAAVGEFTPAQWEKVRSESDAALAGIVARRDGVKSELARVEALRSQIAAPVRPAAAAAAPAALAPATPAPAPAPVAPTALPATVAPTALPATPAPTALPAMPARPMAHAEPAPSRPTPAPPAGAVQGKDDESGRARPAHTPGGGRFDELAFIKSVVASTPPIEPEPSTPPRPAGARLSGERPRPDLAEAPRPAAAPAPASAANDVRVPGERKSGQTAAPAPQPAAPRASDQTIIKQSDQSAPLARVSSGTTLTKTLKCAECGTMNYPTEWYCERCGGELAAL